MFAQITIYIKHLEYEGKQIAFCSLFFVNNVEENDDMIKNRVSENYYKAYETRYKQVYEANMLWSSKEYTPDVLSVIKKLKINKEAKILDLGCGEGRDAIFLLRQHYNVLAIDYSKNVIDKCNELSNNEFVNSFRQFDLIKDNMEDKFTFIYSIAVLHMFVLESHRNKYLKFIYDHLDKDGKALICVLGNGTEEYSSDINIAFHDTERIVLNNMETLNIATTSCKIVNWKTMGQEMKNNDLFIERRWISNSIPEFKESMCMLVSKIKKEEK